MSDFDFEAVYQECFEEYARDFGLCSGGHGGEILREFSYKDVRNIIDPHDLPHRDYAPLLKGVRYSGMRGDTLRFFVKNNINGWMTYIKYPQWWEQVNDRSMDPTEAARLLLWAGDIQIFCGCPSYSFHGYKYIDSQLGIAIVPEVRFPKIRNPHLLGIACKHLRRSLITLPFHLGEMAQAIKFQRSRIEAGKNARVYVRDKS